MNNNTLKEAIDILIKKLEKHLLMKIKNLIEEWVN